MSNILNKYKTNIETKITESNLKLNFEQSDLITTISQLNDITESIGIIDSVTIVNNVLYCVAYRLEQTLDVHVEKQYYNCMYPMYLNNYSIWELMFPLKNIDLTFNIVDPKSFIGKYVRVKEKNNKVKEMEYIGELPSLDLSPISVQRDVLNNIRNILQLSSLNDEDSYTRDILKYFGLKRNLIDDLYSKEYSVQETSGKVLVLKGDAQMTQETSIPPDGIVSINVPKIDVPNKNGDQTEQKSKKCHFPAIVFSARS